MSDSPRILFVSSVGGLTGGAERSLVELARGLQAGGARPSLAVWSDGELARAFRAATMDVYVLHAEPRDPASPLGGRTVGLPFVGPLVRLAAWLRLALLPLRAERAWLRRVLETARPDVIHTNCDIAPLVVAGIERRRGVWVAHVRDRWRAWTHPRVARALRGADAVVASSRSLAGWISGRGVRAVVIGNPVEPARLARSVDADERARLRRGFAIPDGHIAVAIVGRLDAQKGARMLHEVVRGTERATFLLAGHADPRMRVELEDGYRAAGVADRVRLLGYREDVDEWLPAMDVLLLASKAEAFGRVVVEAMLAGLAVVAPDDGGARELVRHRETGLLASAGTPDGFVASLRELRDDAELRRRLGTSARHDALAIFAPATIAAQMRRLYDELAC